MDRSPAAGTVELPDGEIVDLSGAPPDRVIVVIVRGGRDLTWLAEHLRAIQPAAALHVIGPAPVQTPDALQALALATSIGVAGGARSVGGELLALASAHKCAAADAAAAVAEHAGLVHEFAKRAAQEAANLDLSRIIEGEGAPRLERLNEVADPDELRVARELFSSAGLQDDALVESWRRGLAPLAFGRARWARLVDELAALEQAIADHAASIAEAGLAREHLGEILDAGLALAETRATVALIESAIASEQTRLRRDGGMVDEDLALALRFDEQKAEIRRRLRGGVEQVRLIRAELARRARSADAHDGAQNAANSASTSAAGDRPRSVALVAAAGVTGSAALIISGAWAWLPGVAAISLLGAGLLGGRKGALPLSGDQRTVGLKTDPERVHDESETQLSALEAGLESAAQAAGFSGLAEVERACGCAVALRALLDLRRRHIEEQGACRQDEEVLRLRLAAAGIELGEGGAELDAALHSIRQRLERERENRRQARRREEVARQCEHLRGILEAVTAHCTSILHELEEAAQRLIQCASAVRSRVQAAAQARERVLAELASWLAPVSDMLASWSEALACRIDDPFDNERAVDAIHAFESSSIDSCDEDQCGVLCTIALCRFLFVQPVSPFYLIDPFIALDDDRLGAVLRVLAARVASATPVVLFTAHRSRVSAATDHIWIAPRRGS